MFHSIRRHQKWLWAVITTVVIVSFVAFFSPKSQRGRPRGAGLHPDAVGTMNGKPVHMNDYFNAKKEATLRYLFTYNQWPGDEMSRQLGIVERETKNRLLLIDKLQELDVKVSEEAVADWIAQAFQDRATKVFRKEAYDRFVKETLPAKGLSAADFQRFAKNEVGIQHLISVAGVAGKLVTPQEAEAQFRQENEMVDTEVVFFSHSNFLAKVTIDPVALNTYFTNRQAAYRLPERVQVRYVKFESTNYFAEADAVINTTTNLSRQIDSRYAQAGTNYVDAAGKPLPAEEAKAKIKAEFREQLALMEAEKRAVAFENELMEMKPLAPDSMDKLAAAKGLVVKVTEPFGQYDEPKMADVPERLGQVAFTLNEAEPFGEQPLAGEHGIYVIGFKKRIPSELPPMESIKDRLTEDFRRSKAVEMAQAQGRQFQSSVTNAIAQGKTFDVAAKAAGLTPLDLPPFSQNTTAISELGARADLSTLKTVAFALQPGTASAFTPGREGGFVVFAQAKVPVPDARVKSELPDFMKTLRQTRQNEAFGNWFRRELELAKITIQGEKPELGAAAN